MKTMTHRPVYLILLIALLAMPLSGCTAIQGSQSSNAKTTQAASHGKDAQPGYDVVFPQDKVNRIDITLTGDAWTGLQTEMTEQFGQQGAGDQGGPGQGPGRPNPGNQNDQPQPPAGNRQNPGNGQPGNPPGNGGGMDFGQTSYVSSTVRFNGETWNSVGFRYSGNSTLQTSWRNGTQKISFRLDFEQFEDQDPATRNQRFYGFKQLSFKSNAMDSSYLREKVVGDIFRASGVIAPRTAFYEVYVDYGEGSKYFGLYTVVEIVDDTVIKTQFADDSGNVYKPEGSGAAFVDGTFSKAAFEKQTNQDQADWSDIKAAFSALNSGLRTSDPAAWRKGLESVFDVDAFIRWLAVDTILQNWDTYGTSAHNYYLYTNPGNGLVTWIPWDNNMALSANMGGRGRGVRELDLSSVSNQWPLIRYLMDDTVYQAKYRQYLQATIQSGFQPEKLAAIYQKYHVLIAPYVQKETQGYTQLQSIDNFNASVDGLIQHAKDRYNAVIEYLAHP